MRFRDTPSDRERHLDEQRAFVPRCCPHPDCPSRLDQNFEWTRYGWHETKRAPFLVQRFRCKRCKRTFSTQTFHETYWQKRPELDRAVFFGAINCSGNRQIARANGCTKSTVAEKLKRLARQAIRFHVHSLAPAPPLGGDVLFDGLGTFEHSQYWPYWLNVGVQQETSFVLGFTESALRRSGRMRPSQKRKREELEARFGRPDPQAIRRGTAELLQSIRPYLDLRRTRLVSDESRWYPPAIRDAGLGDLEHKQVSGSLQRTPKNPLFEINLADMMIRHGNSSQKRETIAFNKRRQAGLERAWIWAAWRNFMCPRRIKRPGPTPAQLAGVASRRLTFEDIFEWRLLPEAVSLPAPWGRQVQRAIDTPVIGPNTRHRARYCR
jgi:transposase-like protein